MKVSLFYELQVPRPWDGESERLKIQEALDQIELADQLGFHGAWAVEHHFLEEYAHSSAPEVFLAAASQRTKNMRLGHGIMQTVAPINHPLRVAERIAMLDLVSGGRAEFGSGEGASEGELGAFGVAQADKRAMWEEGLQIAIAAMTEEPFAGWDGNFLKLPPRNVVPKPYQRPHPPLSMATSKRETIRLAAQRGLGALAFFFLEADACEAWVNEYYSILESECVPVGHDINPNFALTATTMWGPTQEEAVARVGEARAFFNFASGHYYQNGIHAPGRTDLWKEFVAWRAEQAASSVTPSPTGKGGAASFAVGDSAHIAAYFKRYEDVGVDEMLLLMQLGNVRHEHVMETIERLGQDVLPEIRERDEAGAAARSARVDALREAALARKPPSNRGAPNGYTFGVIESGMKQAMDELGRVYTGEQSETRPETAPRS